MEERETIARLHNCILALVKKHVQLYDTSIQYTYDASLKYSVSGGERGGAFPGLEQNLL